MEKLQALAQKDEGEEIHREQPLGAAEYTEDEVVGLRRRAQKKPPVDGP